MNLIKPCPICGKPMAEEAKFPGLWICPDGKIQLNDSPPYRFKCDGLMLTKEGSEEFLKTLRETYLERN